MQDGRGTFIANKMAHVQITNSVVRESFFIATLLSNIIRLAYFIFSYTVFVVLL